MTRPRAPLARAAWTVLLALWCAASWRLSSASDPESLVGVHVPLPDWMEHGIEYAVGGLLAAGVISSWRRGSVFAAAVCSCAAWGALDEYHQSFVPGRDSSGMDLAADVCGAATGAAAFVALRRRGPSRRGPAAPEADGATDDEQSDLHVNRSHP